MPDQYNSFWIHLQWQAELCEGPVEHYGHGRSLFLHLDTSVQKRFGRPKHSQSFQDA